MHSRNSLLVLLCNIIIVSSVSFAITISAFKILSAEAQQTESATAPQVDPAPESPYSFAIGKRENVQKEDNVVAATTEDFITSLKGPKGDFLSIASTGLALVSFIAGLKAGAIVFGIMAVGFLSISHPLIALGVAGIGLIIHRLRRKDDDEDDFRPTKKADEKKEKTPPTGPALNPTSKTTTERPTAPKINRPV